jgi:hypothetical protein
MLQIHAFQLPDEIEKANEFLRAHKPAGNIHFQQDLMLVFEEDGSVPSGYAISEYNELLVSVRAARIQQQVALHVMQFERAELNMVSNKGKYEELSHGIKQTEKAIALQDAKEAHLVQKIEELRNQK